jgi:YtoQ family protein
MSWNVYLAGEIHSDWREQIASGAERAGLNVAFTSPVTDHGASDEVGVAILGDERDNFWKDHKGAGVNAIRTQTLIRQADVVVVRFGDRYKQWNAAFDAGLRRGVRQADHHAARSRYDARAEGDRPGRDGHGRDTGAGRGRAALRARGQAARRRIVRRAGMGLESRKVGEREGDR